MEYIGVWSRDPALARELEEAGAPFPVLGGCRPADFAAPGLALLILTPSPPDLGGPDLLAPSLALLPGDDPVPAQIVRARSAVSYGLGSRNTLTLSSLEPGRASVALQREVLTLSGALVERQEWVLPFEGGRPDPETFLCRMGARLLLDLPFE